MRTRAEMNAERNRVSLLMTGAGKPGFALALERLCEEERAYVDRKAMARAVRWAAEQWGNTREGWTLPKNFILKLADRIESGEVEVPK